jgi:sensor histidine kinase regulating citrate/malate metabolism
VNLLKNAFESVSKVDGEKYISTCIRKDEQFLYINIKNKYNSSFLKCDDCFETMKADKQNHGFGLKTIKNIVAKYDGKIGITPSENEFEVEIIFENSIYKNS